MIRLISFFFVVAFGACSGARAEPLNLVGTGDGMDILRALSGVYGASFAGERLDVPPSIGSGGAIAGVGAGRERVGRIARALTPLEVSGGLESKDIFEIPSAFYVHTGVSVRSLKSSQLAAIFAGQVTNWKEVGGPDMRIRVVRREEADSSLTVLRAALPPFRNLALTERSKLALTTQDAIASVRDNEGAIGFAPYSVETAALLGVISVDGKAPASREYPAKVRVAVIWREGKMDEDIKRLLTFFATPEARTVIERFGAHPVAP